MADYQYTGLTAYIKESDANAGRLRVLAEAFYSLSHSAHVNMNEDIHPMYHGVVSSPAFERMEERAGMTSMEDFYFPHNTPVEYQLASIVPVTVKGQNFLRLYLPLVAKHGVDEMVSDAIRPVLMTLFRDDLVNIKTRTAMEYDTFSSAPETVVLSANRVYA